MNKLFFILALLLAVSMTANGQRYLRSGGVSGGRPSMTPTTTIGDAPDDASDSVVDDSPAANTPVVKPDTRPEGNASTGNNSSNNNNNNSSNNNSSNNNSSNNNTSTPKPTTNTTANNTSTPKPTTNTTTPKPTTNTTTNNTSTPKPTTNTTTNNTSTPKPTTNTTTNNTSTPKPTTNTTTTTPKPTTNSTSTNSSSSSSNSSSSNSSSSSSSNSSSSSSSSSSTVSAFAATCLKGHNEERASLGIAPLKWSTTLAKAAQSWADTIASRGQLDHSDNRVHVGENTARRTYKSGVDSAELLVGQWLDEKKYFKKGNYPNISTTGSTSDVGHYSAMIWAKTTELGCGIARAGGRDYLVCQYAESGNRHGKPVY